MKQLFEYLNAVLVNAFTRVTGTAAPDGAGNLPAEILALLFLLLASGWIFCPFLALLAKAAAAIRKKNLYNHFARQLTQAGLLAALPALPAGLVLCGIYGCTADLRDLVTEGTLSLNLTPKLARHLSGAAFLLLLPLQGLTLLFWPRQRKPRSPAVALLALSALAAGAAALLFIYAFLAPAEHAGEMPATSAALSYGYMIALFFACFTLAASWSGFWLLTGRNKNDFGRDYYTFALRRCAWAAFSPGLICVAALFTQTMNRTLTLAAAALQVVCCVLWFFAARSATPLRHKSSFRFCLPAWAAAASIIFLSGLHSAYLQK
jgi:hypothetical protein